MKNIYHRLAWAWMLILLGSLVGALVYLVSSDGSVDAAPRYNDASLIMGNYPDVTEPSFISIGVTSIQEGRLRGFTVQGAIGTYRISTGNSTSLSCDITITNEFMENSSLEVER